MLWENKNKVSDFIPVLNVLLENKTKILIKIQDYFQWVCVQWMCVYVHTCVWDRESVCVEGGNEAEVDETVICSLMWRDKRAFNCIAQSCPALSVFVYAHSENYSHDSHAFIHSEEFVTSLEKQFQSCVCRIFFFLPTTVITLRQLKLLCENWKMNRANLNCHVHTDSEL